MWSTQPLWGEPNPVDIGEPSTRPAAPCPPAPCPPAPGPAPPARPSASGSPSLRSPVAGRQPGSTSISHSRSAGRALAVATTWTMPPGGAGSVSRSPPAGGTSSRDRPISRAPWPPMRFAVAGAARAATVSGLRVPRGDACWANAASPRDTAARTDARLPGTAMATSTARRCSVMAAIGGADSASGPRASGRGGGIASGGAGASRRPRRLDQTAATTATSTTSTTSATTTRPAAPEPLEPLEPLIDRPDRYRGPAGLGQCPTRTPRRLASCSPATPASSGDSTRGSRAARWSRHTAHPPRAAVA